MKLAIFDFDGTLVPKDALPFVLAQWKKQNYSKIKYLIWDPGYQINTRSENP